VRTRVDIRWLASSRSMVVHVASSQRLHGSEAKDNRFEGVGCGAVEVGPNYPSLDVIFFLAHRGILVFCFHYKYDPKGWWRGKHSTIPLPPPNHSCFLRGVGMLHGVREERRESERSLQSTKEWEDVVVFTPCRCLILSI
jgi:hypothetical protein